MLAAANKKGEALIILLPGDLGGDRTLDPMIKSHLLYQLSYEVGNDLFRLWVQS